MDDKLDKILKILEEKKNKYPNITNVWKRVINNQIQYLQDTLNHCENIFVNIDNNTVTLSENSDNYDVEISGTLVKFILFIIMLNCYDTY